MTQELNEHLVKSYGGFADKRFTRIEFGRAIAIDHGHFGEFNESIHCRFFVRAFDDDEIEITYTGNRPTDARIERLQAPLVNMRIRLTKETPANLRSLAVAYQRVNVPKHQKSWYYARKEVSTDLEHLAKCLEAFISVRGRFDTKVPDTEDEGSEG